MTHDQEQKLRDFEFLVRRLIVAYEEEKRDNAVLRAALETDRLNLREMQENMKTLESRYETLRTARIIEVSGDDVKDARARLARLIREVDKCIALLDI